MSNLHFEAKVEDWIQTVEFETTKDVPIPEKMVDQVIGQEDAAIVIKKAAKQRRHVIMIGDPGTGKSMLAKSMVELLPDDELEDLLCYPNDDDDNEIDNNNIEPLSELGRIFENENNFEQAKTYFEQALKIDIDHRKTNLRIGNMYLKMNQHKKGLKFIQKSAGLIRFSEKGFEII